MADQPPSSETLTEVQRNKIETWEILVDGHDESKIDCPNPEECAIARDAIAIIDSLLAEVAALREELSKWRGTVWRTVRLLQESQDQRERLQTELYENGNRFRDERDDARATLANVSGALCDSGVVVPAEATQYGEAIRVIVAERDEARAALAAIRTITSTLEVHADGARCSDALAQLQQASPYGYGDLLSAIEVGVPKLLDVIRRCATEARRALDAGLAE